MSINIAKYLLLAWIGLAAFIWISMSTLARHTPASLGALRTPIIFTGEILGQLMLACMLLIHQQELAALAALLTLAAIVHIRRGTARHGETD